MAVDSFDHLPVNEKVCLLGLINNDTLEQLLGKLAKIALSPMASPELVVAIYRAFLRNQNPSLVDIARKHFNHANSKIAAAAIEYAGKLSPEWFVRVSGKLLQKRNRAVYRAAVKTLNRLSPDAAVSAIRAMIASGQTKQLGNAINCMIFLDFAIIREIATTLAVNTRNDEIFGAIMLLFQNNPELENLKCLFRIEKHQKNPVWSDLAKHIRHENTDILHERNLLGNASSEDIEKNLAENFMILQQFQITSTDQINLAGEKQQQVLSTVFMEQLQNLKSFIRTYLVENRKFAISLTLLSAVVIFLFYPVDLEQTSLDTAFVYSPMTEIARVKECEQDYAIIELKSDSSLIKIRPFSGRFNCKHLAHQSVEVELVLTRKSRKGEMFAICTRIKRIIRS